MTVSLGSDENSMKMKGKVPVYPEDERKYMLEALDCVDRAVISSDSGPLSFVSALNELNPDAFIINEDGDHPDKRRAIKQRGIEYIVLERTPQTGLAARSSSALRTSTGIPYSLNIAGGFADQLWQNGIAPSTSAICSIEPTFDFEGRSGIGPVCRD